MAKPTARTVKLSDLIPDSRNANKGTLRGLAMLDDSLREDGAGRGILLDRNNNIIAGNKTIERAVDAGFEEIIIVPTDGKQLVATQRVDVDLDSPQGRRMGLRDNRVAEVDLTWDSSVLASLQDEIDLSGLFNDQELTILINDVIEQNLSDDKLTNDNFARMHNQAGQLTLLNWRDIMVTLPIDLYRRAEQFVSLSHHESRQAAMIELIEAGLAQCSK